MLIASIAYYRTYWWVVHTKGSSFQKKTYSRSRVISITSFLNNFCNFENSVQAAITSHRTAVTERIRRSVTLLLRACTMGYYKTWLATMRLIIIIKVSKTQDYCRLYAWKLTLPHTVCPCWVLIQLKRQCFFPAIHVDTDDGWMQLVMAIFSARKLLGRAWVWSTLRGLQPAPGRMLLKATCPDAFRFEFAQLHRTTPMWKRQLIVLFAMFAWTVLGPAKPMEFLIGRNVLISFLNLCSADNIVSETCDNGCIGNGMYWQNTFHNKYRRTKLRIS